MKIVSRFTQEMIELYRDYIDKCITIGRFSEWVIIATTDGPKSILINKDEDRVIPVICGLDDYELESLKERLKGGPKCKKYSRYKAINYSA